MRIQTKEDRRDRIKFRIRKRLQGTADQPRLSVFRSGAHIYVQVIDDLAVLDGGHDARRQRLPHLALGPLHLAGGAVDLDGDALGNRDWLLTDT